MGQDRYDGQQSEYKSLTFILVFLWLAFPNNTDWVIINIYYELLIATDQVKNSNYCIICEKPEHDNKTEW